MGGYFYKAYLSAEWMVLFFRRILLDVLKIVDARKIFRCNFL